LTQADLDPVGGRAQTNPVTGGRALVVAQPGQADRGPVIAALRCRARARCRARTYLLAARARRRRTAAPLRTLRSRCLLLYYTRTRTRAACARGTATCTSLRCAPLRTRCYARCFACRTTCCAARTRAPLRPACTCHTDYLLPRALPRIHPELVLLMIVIVIGQLLTNWCVDGGNYY